MIQSFKWQTFLCLLTIVLLACATLSQANSTTQTNRFFVGTKVCIQCHNNPANGNQYGIWQLSAHSKAFARLASERSDLITSLSGLTGDPVNIPICLGCHATASDTDEWQRDVYFDISEGVQCESCHGPGSEYSSWEIMSDKKAAKAAGLIVPDETFCLTCHQHNESHEARLEVGTVIFQHPKKGEVYFNFQEALKKINHNSQISKAAKSLAPPKDINESDDYLGLVNCDKCHGAKTSGYLTSKWRLSKHAEAYAVLSTPEAFTITLRKGIDTIPQNSTECLRCHSTGFYSKSIQEGVPQVDIADGVQCESCHGPGKLYATKTITETTTDTTTSDTPHSSVPKVDQKTCGRCHNGYHGREFSYDEALSKIEHRIPLKVTDQQHLSYKTPFNLTINRDGTRLYVSCEASNSLIIIDTKQRKVIEEVAVMNLPHGVCLSPDEDKIYVSNRGSDTVSVIDTSTFKVLQTIAVGDEPHELMTNQSGSMLVVTNTGSHDISIIDLQQGKEIKRLAGGRGTWGLAKTPDYSSIVATNNLSHFVPFRSSSLSELTVIDTEEMKVSNRIMVPDANLIQGIDYSPDGEFALVTLLRTKNLVPIVRVVQGWMITNGFGILWKDGRVDQLLIDGVDNHFADPTDVVITPDSKYGYITGGGVNEVAVIDLVAVKKLLKESSPEEKSDVLPNHLGVSEKYVTKRIPVGTGPRGLATDGRYVYVADALDDAISIIDIEKQERIGTIDLGGPKVITQIRKGERIFHSANVTYGRQYSCHSCHPDGGVDGLSYDISPDGLGFNPVDNRTLRGVLDTAPFKWTGKNVSLSRQCGPRLAVFFTRIDPFTPEQARDLESYICTIPRNPNRFQKDGQLTSAQQRGKLMFNRTHTNAGEEITTQNRCNNCHSGPYFTKRKVSEVGTASPLDTNGKFDVPHLNNIYETAPYLHDGRANTLEEIWTVYNPEDKHGVTNDMTKDQLNDLIEYLKIL